MGDSPASILHNTSGTEIATVANPVRVDPTGTTTQPVSATALPLPTGAATSAKQPALGTAGSPSADVLSVQGVASGTPQPVSDGGGSITVDGTVTANAGTGPFPVSDNGGSLTIDGAVTANIGTSGSLALDATLTGGTQKAVVRGGAKGTTVAADVTSTAEGADHQALDVQIMHGGAAKDPTQVRALTSADVVTAAQGTAAAAAGGWPAKVTDGTNVAAVKAASTAAVAADPALVVAVSPNNTPVLPSGAATSALQGTGNTSLSNIDGKLATLGQKAMAGSVPVTLASDQSVIAMRDAPATAATVASVAAAVADTTLLAANASRMGAAVFNASTAILYLKLGTGASAASYTVRMTPNAYYEVPFGYSGQINGYWAAANGAALVTQVTQ